MRILSVALPREDAAARRVLATLRWSLLLGTLVFVFTAADTERYFPPIQPMVQGVVLLALAGWWTWKVMRRQRLLRSLLAPLLAAGTFGTLLLVDQRRSLDGLLLERRPAGSLRPGYWRR